jgi:hypothetical protein
MFMNLLTGVYNCTLFTVRYILGPHMRILNNLKGIWRQELFLKYC